MAQGPKGRKKGRAIRSESTFLSYISSDFPGLASRIFQKYFRGFGTPSVPLRFLITTTTAIHDGRVTSSHPTEPACYTNLVYSLSHVYAVCTSLLKVRECESSKPSRRCPPQALKSTRLQKDCLGTQGYIKLPTQPTSPRSQ